MLLFYIRVSGSMYDPIFNGRKHDTGLGNPTWKPDMETQHGNPTYQDMCTDFHIGYFPRTWDRWSRVPFLVSRQIKAIFHHVRIWKIVRLCLDQKLGEIWPWNSIGIRLMTVLTPSYCTKVWWSSYLKMLSYIFWSFYRSYGPFLISSVRISPDNSWLCTRQISMERGIKIYR